MNSQLLEQDFSRQESEFLKLWTMWNCIMLSKKRQMQDNLKIKIRTWKEKNGLEELKEEYLHAVIMRRTCGILANISQFFWLKLSEQTNPELPEIDWKKVSKELGFIRGSP